MPTGANVACSGPGWAGRSTRCDRAAYRSRSCAGRRGSRGARTRVASACGSDRVSAWGAQQPGRTGCVRRSSSAMRRPCASAGWRPGAVARAPCRGGAGVLLAAAGVAAGRRRGRGLGPASVGRRRSSQGGSRRCARAREQHALGSPWRPSEGAPSDHARWKRGSGNQCEAACEQARRSPPRSGAGPRSRRASSGRSTNTRHGSSGARRASQLRRRPRPRHEGGKAVIPSSCPLCMEQAGRGHGEGAGVRGAWSDRQAGDELVDRPQDRTAIHSSRPPMRMVSAGSAAACRRAMPSATSRR